MIVFEDQDGDYEVEQLKKSNVATKIRVAALFVFFIIIVSAFARNDYDFDFSGLSGDKEIKFKCEKESSNRTVDDLDKKLQEATEVLNNNMEIISGLRGYVGSSASLEPVGFKDMPVPVVTIVLNQINNDKKYPEKICGYNLKVIYQ